MDYRKVYGGTPVGSESRCDSCSYAHIVRGFSSSEKIVVCEWPYPSVRIPFPVSECSHYANGRLPDFGDLEKIAWDLTRVKTARAGFKTAKNGTNAGKEEEGTGEADIGFAVAAKSLPGEEAQDEDT